MKRIYITTKHSEGAFNVSDGTLIFKKIKAVLQNSLGLSFKVGEEDIIIENKNLEVLKGGLRREIEQLVNNVKEDRNAIEKKVIFNKPVILNPMSEDHRLINHLLMVYKMTEGEILNSGGVYVFNLSDLDVLDNQIITLLKQYGKPGTAEFFYGHLIKRHPEHTAVSFQQFELQMRGLMKRGFVSEESTTDSATISVTEKTKMIHF
jgi:hypothetical protein